MLAATALLLNDSSFRRSLRLPDHDTDDDVMQDLFIKLSSRPLPPILDKLESVFQQVAAHHPNGMLLASQHRAFTELDRSYPEVVKEATHLLRTSGRRRSRDRAKAEARRKCHVCTEASIESQIADACARPDEIYASVRSSGGQYASRCNYLAPSRHMERRETWKAIAQAIRSASLPERHRCVLRAWLRNCLDEFAARRSIPKATARVWAHRARAALRPFLTQLAIEEGII
jgi:DNA-directed RNA polymerase specialized sigma24 family protein